MNIGFKPKLKTLKKYTNPPKPQSKRHYHALLCYDTQGNFLKSFTDIPSEVLRFNPDLKLSLINMVSSGNEPPGTPLRTCGGYIWRKQIQEGDPIDLKLTVPKTFRKPGSSVKIASYSKKGYLMDKYPSVKGMVRSCGFKRWTGVKVRNGADRGCLYQDYIWKTYSDDEPPKYLTSDQVQWALSHEVKDNK